MKNKIVINKVFISFCSLILFPICNVLARHYSFFSYFDELMACCAAIYVAFMLMNNRIKKTDVLVIFIMFLITLIGFFSNVVSSLVTSPLPIALDCVGLWKPFLCLLYFKYFFSSKEMWDIATSQLAFFSKIVIVINLVLASVGQFVDLGVVSNAKNIGPFKQYMFLWDNAIQTGWFLMGSLILLSLCEKRIKDLLVYSIMAFTPLLLTFSSLVYCWMVLYVVLFFLLRGEKTIKMIQVSCVGALIGLIVFEDIRTYFLSESVRATFIKYGIKTANDYFPLGSGFATFGSEMAARYYSKLYINYGWEYTWALGRDGHFLNDNYFASILGQYGWIGLGLFSICLILLFQQVNNSKLCRYTRSLDIATMLTIIVSMIGSASCKSMMGAYIFGVLGLSQAQLILNRDNE